MIGEVVVIVLERSGKSRRPDKGGIRHCGDWDVR